MPNPFYHIVAVALCLLPACKTERSVRWEKGESSDRLSERFVGQSVDRWEDGQQHEMDRKRTSPGKVFGRKHGNEQFGDRQFGTKKFGGNRAFSGNRKYDPDTYHFVRAREMAREEAASAGKPYRAAGQTAPEGGQRWFGRDKSVAKKAAYGSDKVVEHSGYRAAQDAQGDSRQSNVDILNPRGSGSEPKELSIDEVKKMLKR